MGPAGVVVLAVKPQAGRWNSKNCFTSDLTVLLSSSESDMMQWLMKLVWNGWLWIVSSCLFSDLWAAKSVPSWLRCSDLFQVASAALSGLSMTPESSPLFISIMAGVAISKLSHLHLWQCASGSTKNPSAFKVTLAKLQDMGLKRVAHLLQIWWFVVIPVGEPGFQFISEARTMPNTPALVGLGASAYASLLNRGGKWWPGWSHMCHVQSTRNSCFTTLWNVYKLNWFFRGIHRTDHSRMPWFLSYCFWTLNYQSPCLETWITHDTGENATSCGSCKVLGSGASGSDGATVERVWDLSKFLHVSTAGLYLCYIFGTENLNHSKTH